MSITSIAGIATNTTDMQHTDTQQDFWLLYPTAIGTEKLAEAMHALYYLPANYKLIVLNSALSNESMLDAEGAIMKRIRFEPGTGLSNGASPFSYADAVIYDDVSQPSAPEDATPTVVVSQDASKDIETNDHNGFTVSAGNPEALATAVLRIARAAA